MRSPSAAIAIPWMQVYISYGSLSDAQTLHTYGFVAEDVSIPPVTSHRDKDENSNDDDDDESFDASIVHARPFNSATLTISDLLRAALAVSGYQ